MTNRTQPKIEMPDVIFGKKVEGATERYFKKFEEKEKALAEAERLRKAGNSTQQIDNFIYVPSINLYVAKERTHLGKDWFESHKALINEGLRMPTIPEFIEFLKYTKTNFPEIYNERIEARNPRITEWLDADFKIKNGELHINYYHVLDSNENLIPRNSEPLEECLMKDKTPGISLEDYLANNHTNHGLPSNNIKSGNLYYYFPRSDNNSVAKFDVIYGRTYLGCCWNPSGRNSILGVRAVKEERK